MPYDLAHPAFRRPLPPLPRAAEWLWVYLAAGPRPVREIRRAAHAAGISWRTLRRAQRLTAYSLKPCNDSPRCWTIHPELLSTPLDF